MLQRCTNPKNAGYPNYGGRGIAVQQTKIGDEVKVSTVFLGLDHNFADTPLLYETMVFGGKLDGEQYRYSTRIQAERGHDEMCEKARKAGRQNRFIDLGDDT